MGMFNPENMGEGGGLLSDANVKVKKSEFVMFDYGGKSTEDAPALAWTLDHDGEEVMQYWSAGKASDWKPSKDGNKLVAIGGATVLNKNSNVGLLMKSLMEAGFPADKMGDEADIFENMECHVMRVPAPVREGLEGAKKDQKILVVDKIIKLPWEKKGSGGGKTAAAKGKATKGEEEDPVKKLAADTITDILMEAGEAMTKKVLAKKMYDTLKSDPNRNAAVKLAYDEDFLTEIDGVSVDGDDVSMG